MSDPTDKPAVPTLEIDDTVFETAPTRKFANRTPYAPRDPRKILCFIPGIIRKIHVAPGRKIRRGDHLLILEAMKMQNDISSPEEGTVKKIHVTVGQMVTKGQILIELE
jgi:biotin carboxyl carrier protein